MKKVLLLFSTVLLFACSNENEENNLENVETENASNLASRPLPPIEDEIDEIFYLHVTSEIFNEVRNLILEFKNDLNYYEDYNDIRNPISLMVWIENNIENTNFLNLEEAQYRWNHISHLKQIEIENFSTVYSYIAEAPIKEVAIRIWKWHTPIITTTNNKCQNNYNDCTKAAAETLAYFSRNILASGVEDAGSYLASEQDCYEETMSQCQRSLDACLKK